MTGRESKPSAQHLPDGAGLVVGIVSARWNADIVDRLAAGARDVVDECGATFVATSAPGAFELPFAASVLSRSGRSMPL